MTANAKAESLRSRIDSLVDNMSGDLITLRRHLHANPEIGFQEHETSKMVQDLLKECDLEPRTGFGGTGVAALVGSGQGKTIGIRGDMDALPIQETGNSEYRSRRDGLMHACGHDAHTTIAIGVAMVLAKLQDELPGRALMIFQPAEEGLGGARAMLADGLLDWVKPDVMLGYHNWPLIDAGTIGWHPHTAFASTDPFDIEIVGKSGHGAHPHLAVDPIVAAGALVSSLQTVISREIAPLDAAVVSIGSIHGGSARNQIPDKVVLEGTTRSQDPQVRERIRESIKRVCAGVSQTHAVECRPVFLDGVPPVINDPEILHSVLETARTVIGAENVVELPKGSMGSEDYAEFSSRFPSAHLRIGSRLEGLDTMLHRSNFDLDERCIPTAVRVLSAAAIELME